MYRLNNVSRQLNIPLRLFLVCNMLALILLPAGTHHAIAAPPTAILDGQVDTTNHSITVDGDLSDWSTNELMETDGPATLYITWDATNIYLGLSNVYLGDTPAQDKSFFACIDVDQTAGSGATSDGYSAVNFNTSVFAPEYCYYFAGGAGWYEWSTWSSGAWSWNGWRNDGTYYNWPSNSAPIPGSELTIIRSEIGNPSSLRVAAWLTPEESTTLEATWPSQNAAGTTPTFALFYHFPSLVSGIEPDDSLLADHILIHEVQTKGAERVELYNPTDAVIDIGSWVISGQYYSPAFSKTIPSGTTIGPGEFYDATPDSGALSNDGDIVTLQDMGSTIIDQVGFGNQGGAVIAWTNTSLQRTPNGTDTDDHARDWNTRNVTLTFNAPNNASAVMLGSTVVFNEFDNYPTSGNDKVEIFNPTDQAISLQNWLISDGDYFGAIVTTKTVDPGSWVILEENVDWSGTSLDFSSTDVGYLFLPNGIRVDQLGWSGEYEDFTFQRLGDGEGPNDGYNWASSGGGSTLYDIASTLGSANESSVSLEITKTAPAVSYPDSLLIYDISVTNNGVGHDATGVVVTDTIPLGVEYAYGGDVYANGVVTYTTPSEIPWGTTVEYSFAVTVTANYGEEIINDHYGVVSSETGPISGDPVVTDIAAFDLTVDKQAPSAVPQGSQYLTYTINVTNAGVIGIDNVVVTDTLPAGTTYVSDDSGIVPTNPSPGKYVWALGDLLPDTGLTFNLIVTVDAVSPGTIFENTVVISTDTPDDPPGNNTDTTTTYVYLPIHTIQGESHISPYNGTPVGSVYGIVTVVRSNAFYMQDPNIDANDATSEAIYVYTSSSPGLSVGDEVVVAGTVTEYRAGGTGGLNNLTLTEITGPTVTLLSSGNPLPVATVIGNTGRIPPAEIIDNDSTGDVEVDGTFDPEEDGIDFYESLECMLVQIADAIAVAATNSYGEIAVVGDSGSNAGAISPRGSLVIQEGDFNPERILVDDTIISSEPQVNTGSIFNAPIVGVLDYNYANFKLYNTTALDVTNNTWAKEITEFSPGDHQITVATFNVENLDPLDDASRFDALAIQVVTHMLSPDIIAVQEIQDNNGATDDGTVAADETFQALIEAIVEAGGPTYEYRQINPEDNMDGGEPGGNIRVGFLFRPDRGLEFVDRPGGDATTPVTATLGTTGVELSYSPGRIDPIDDAFLDSRKPLAGEFTYNGNKLIVIANHLNSKGGDQPLFGHFQPPVLSSEVQRLQQATILNDFVKHILSLDAQANVIVLGDLNDFQFSAPISTLAGSELSVLTNLLPAEDRYTYHYDGNAQALDHILVSAALTPTVGYDIVHLNAEYLDATRPTDHDPALTIFTLLPTELYITKSVTPEDNVALGSVVTYTITLNNPEPIYAAGIKLTDTLPVEVAFGDWIENPGAIEDGGTITWSGSLPADNSLTFIFTTTLDLDPALYGKMITNTVFFTSQDSNAGSDDAVFTVQTVPDVIFDKSVEAVESVPLGGVVTYTLSLTNNGIAPAQGVVLTDALPAGLSFGGWVVNNGAQETDGTITWNGDLPGAGLLDFIFTATVNLDPALYGIGIVNVASFTSENAGSGTAEASFAVVQAPVLSIEKMVVLPNDPPQPGDVVTYTITVHNTGLGEAIDVHIVDTLPEGLVGESLDVIVNIASYESASFVITATIDTDITPGSTITNTASFSHLSGDGEASIAFTVQDLYQIYLPILFRH